MPPKSKTKRRTKSAPLPVMEIAVPLSGNMTRGTTHTRWYSDVRFIKLSPGTSVYESKPSTINVNLLDLIKPTTPAQLADFYDQFRIDLLEFWAVGSGNFKMTGSPTTSSHDRGLFVVSDLDSTLPASLTELLNMAGAKVCSLDKLPVKLTSHRPYYDATGSSNQVTRDWLSCLNAADTAWYGIHVGAVDAVGDSFKPPPYLAILVKAKVSFRGLQ